MLNFNLIFHKFVLIFQFKYILLTMQPRLNLRSKTSSSMGRLLFKIFIAISILVLVFYFVEKINLPFPQKEINKDVTDKIIKLK